MPKTEGVWLEPLPDRLKLKAFILKHWTNSWIHPVAHLPSCCDSKAGAHPKYCNGLFIHYKTSEGVLHGEFKQTYVITIQSVLEIIKELAGRLREVPAAKMIPDFDKSQFYPKGYPKPLPILHEPGVRSGSTHNTNTHSSGLLLQRYAPVHTNSFVGSISNAFLPGIKKRSKLAIAMQFWPNLIDEKLLVLEKMPSEPKFLKIPEYRPPSDLKHTPAFQYNRVTADVDMHVDLVTIPLDEPLLLDRRIVAGLVSVLNVGDGNWRNFGECLTCLAKQCQSLVIISPPEEHAKIVAYVEDGEGGGVNATKLGNCKLQGIAERRFTGYQENPRAIDLLKSDMLQARALTAVEFGKGKEKKFGRASHCLCVRIDMMSQPDPKYPEKFTEQLRQERMKISEAWLSPNQILLTPVKLSSGDFVPPPPEIHAPFDGSEFDMPPRPTVRPLMPIPRISDYLPFPFRPHEAVLPKTIDELPEGNGPLSRLKPPKWTDPQLNYDEMVTVPEFKYTDMNEKRKGTQCLSMVAFYPGIELDLEPVKEFQTDERHKIFHLPQYNEPQLHAFEPLQATHIPFERTRWLPTRELENVDRFLLQEDLGSHPVFVLCAGGAMSGIKWQSLLDQMLNLFSAGGRIERTTTSFDVVITLNSNVYSYSGGNGHRRQLTSTSEFACECVRTWLSQWVPSGNADIFEALSLALDSPLASEIHLVSDTHPERSHSILELIGKMCKCSDLPSDVSRVELELEGHIQTMSSNCSSTPRPISPARIASGQVIKRNRDQTQFEPTGRLVDDVRLHINCVAFEGNHASRRFLQRIASMTGGTFREFQSHVSACPMKEVKRNFKGVMVGCFAGGAHNHGTALQKKYQHKARKFWDGVKEALISMGVIGWMTQLDKHATGMISTRHVVQDIWALLESTGMHADKIEEGMKFLTGDGIDENDDNVDIRDFVRAILIDGYSKESQDQQQAPVRFHSLRPNTRECIIQHSGFLKNFFQEVDDGNGEDEFCLLPKDVMKALDAFNAEHKLGISDLELLKCSFLVLPNDAGRIDCKDLLKFFHRDPSKRNERVQQQNQERKEFKNEMLHRECECLKSIMHSDESLLQFLTPSERLERMEHISHEESEFMSKRLNIETEINEKNEARRREIDAANKVLIDNAKLDHERRLKAYHDERNAKIEEDRAIFIERWAAAPAARNASRTVKNAYEIYLSSVSEGAKPDGVPLITMDELLENFVEADGLIAVRMQREFRENRENAHAEALKRMGGSSTVPNVVEYNAHVIQTALFGAPGEGRQGLLHDVRNCPVCSKAAPPSISTEIQEHDWSAIDFKLTFPHFDKEMMISEIAHCVKKALTNQFLVGGDFFVRSADIDLVKLTNLRPDPIETHRGMRVKLQVQCQIYVHAGKEKCRKGVERLDSFLRTGELNNQLQVAGFPMKLLKKCLVKFDSPKVSHRPLDLAEVQRIKRVLQDYESAWNEYVHALESEDARQLEADEDAKAMHERLCKAAERENFRRLTNKKELLLKARKHELRELNDKNIARLKRYQALIATNNIKTNKEERDKYEAKRADSEARFHRDFDLAKENNKTAKIEEETLLVYTENFMKEKSRLAMAMREAKKKWEQEDRRIHRRNEVVMEAARNAYDKVEGVWLKKYDESKICLEKVYADIKACFDAQHEVLERKALGLHKYHYSKQEKVNEMLIEASQALYAKTVRDIENENYALEKKFKSECNRIVSINREREREVLDSKIAAKNHNGVEVERCKKLYEDNLKMIVDLNNKILHALNGQLQEEINATKRENIFMMDIAREKYTKFFKKDIDHNNTVSIILQQTAEIREQLIFCRRFLNVIKKHFADLMAQAHLPYKDPEESSIEAMRIVPELVLTTAAKTFTSWWHEGGPTEKWMMCARLDPRLAEEMAINAQQRAKLTRQDHIQIEHPATKRQTPPNFLDVSELLDESLIVKQHGDSVTTAAVSGAGDTTNPTPPSLSRDVDSLHGRRRPASARMPEKEDGGGLKRWMRPMKRRVPEGKDMFWRMFEQSIAHTPYAPVAGSPLEHKPTLRPRKPQNDEPEYKPKSVHLMSWDERIAEQERLRKLAEKPPTPPPTEPAPPKDPGDEWTPMPEIFEAEVTQPWKKQVYPSPKRPQTARPFGSSSPRHFFWNVAAGSKLLPGGTLTKPQGLEALEVSSHLERMQLERLERQRRIAYAEKLRIDAESKATKEREAKVLSGELATPPNPPLQIGDPDKVMVPTKVLVEALLAAFEHMGVDFEKPAHPVLSITQDSSIIPMLPYTGQPHRHVPDDGKVCHSDGRRMMVPKEIMDVGIFAKHKFHPNKSVFHGRGEFPKAPPEPTREHQALWKTQLYP